MTTIAAPPLVACSICSGPCDPGEALTVPSLDFGARHYHAGCLASYRAPGPGYRWVDGSADAEPFEGLVFGGSL